MKKIVLILNLCIFSMVVPSHAEERGVEVRPAEKELFEVEPREIVTASFQVTNKTSEKREFITSINLPEGWKLITTFFPFELDANETVIKIVSFHVPQTTLSRKYKATFFIQDRKYPSISDRHYVPTTIRNPARLPSHGSPPHALPDAGSPSAGIPADTCQPCRRQKYGGRPWPVTGSGTGGRHRRFALFSRQGWARL